jgi:hypothetical protein
MLVSWDTWKLGNKETRILVDKETCKLVSWDTWKLVDCMYTLWFIQLRCGLHHIGKADTAAGISLFD